MRAISKIVLIVVLITLLYSVAKLISTNSTQNQQQITVKTRPVSRNNQSTQNENQPSTVAAAAQRLPPTPDTPNAQDLYQADEILIDGQGKAGQNYIDITSDTPITPQQANNRQSNIGGGAYAQASVTIDNTTTSAQQYAPGVPAFEVADGN